MVDDSSSAKLQLCLTWNSFTDNIITSLETSYDDGDFVDVTLACEGESIKAHKLVLSACSQYLKRLLKENPCSHPIIILNNVGLSELKDLLIYMYHGEVRVEQDRIAKLLHTAQILEIRGLRDINQRLDQEFENMTHETNTSLTSMSMGSQNNDNATDNCNEKHDNLVNNSPVQNRLGKNVSTVKMSSSSKSSVVRKPRPIPMLQCIQPTSKTDINAVPAMSVSGDEDEGDEGNEFNSSLTPCQPSFLDDVRVKEETPDMTEQLQDFSTNHSSTLDENSSDTEQREFSNGYSNISSGFTVKAGGITLGSGCLATQILKRAASRASNGDTVSIIKESSAGNLISNSSLGEQGAVARPQEDKVTLSLFNIRNQRWKSSSAPTVHSTLPLESETQDNVRLKTWGNENRQTYQNSDLSIDMSHEDTTENMDTDFSQVSVKETCSQNNFPQTYGNPKCASEIEFVRPSEYMSQEGKITSKHLSIENKLNVPPQLRMQMLMCREYKKYTNILLVAMFGREMLATHSLNGTGTSKPRLNGQKVNCIIEAVMAKYGVNENNVKEAIRIKLNNEDKLKKRLTQKSFIGGLQC